ncbi:trypsin-like peptidase domain-containing protein [uncultured Oscillibacter sp.]|uniref:S1C family serine protease n=1 Tax=uncultured Oscillibacter sp. TaxID=876091 RepID=UPI0026328656|nr:trypsin-like peptidase domain-containing protein [uncultured Oscillibacter sp.]
MYNDENNLYNYTYRKDGSELSHQRETVRPGGQPGPQGPEFEVKPVKKNRLGLKIAALALSCALLGGAAGGGAVWAMSQPGGNESEINVSNRPVTRVALRNVDGKTAMSDAEVYAANVNSVVSIRTSATAGYNFFDQPVQSASAGSGFVLSRDGYILTNYHVVKGAETVTVTTYSGDEYSATYIGGEEDYDIAVIKVEAEDLQPVTLGDSGDLNVGDHVLAIGNPLGELTFSMSGGMVSCVDRAINVDGTPFNMIQTDTSINPGNSGGPLFNQYGEVVGIVSAKYSQSSNGTAVEGLGFAIPMNDVFSMVKDIMANGYVSNRAYLGITPQTMTENWAAQYHYDVTAGVFITYVEPDSAADKAGLKMGDVITKVDGTDIKSVEDLNLAKKKYSAGDSATLEVYRPDGTVTVEITWGAAPKEDQTAQQQETQQYPGNRNDNSGNGGSYGSPFEDLFRYFYG